MIVLIASSAGQFRLYLILMTALVSCLDFVLIALNAAEWNCCIDKIEAIRVASALPYR